MGAIMQALVNQMLVRALETAAKPKGRPRVRAELVLQIIEWRDKLGQEFKDIAKALPEVKSHKNAEKLYRETKERLATVPKWATPELLNEFLRRNGSQVQI